MSGPNASTATPLGRLLTAHEVRSTDVAEAMGCSLSSVNKWRQGVQTIPPHRFDALLAVLAALGVDATRRELSEQRTSAWRPRPVLATPWGTAMPYDWFLARRMDAEGLEEAA
jgi:transcriptional regulator with XRE-family HTH domain